MAISLSNIRMFFSTGESYIGPAAFLARRMASRQEERSKNKRQAKRVARTGYAINAGGEMLFDDE